MRSMAINAGINDLQQLMTMHSVPASGPGPMNLLTYCFPGRYYFIAPTLLPSVAAIAMHFIAVITIERGSDLVQKWVEDAHEAADAAAMAPMSAQGGVAGGIASGGRVAWSGEAGGSGVGATAEPMAGAEGRAAAAGGSGGGRGGGGVRDSLDMERWINVRVVANREQEQQSRVVEVW